MTKTVLITGASSGIGYEFAKIFAQAQHNLVLVARNASKLEALKTELEQNSLITVLVLPKDLSHAEAAAEIFEEVTARQLQVDILINNAGFGTYGFFHENPWQSESEMIRVNILSLTHLTHLFLPGMVARQQGKILNVASTAAFQPGPLMSVYYATKAYVLSFSEAIANELEGTGVTVTTLCPGPTASEFQAVAGLSNSNLVKGQTLPTAAEVAQFGDRALQNGQTVAIHGFKNKLLAFSVRLMPRNLVAKIVRQMQQEG